MPDPMSAAAGLLKSFAEMFPSTLGAVVSMQFMPRELSKGQKTFALICAWILGTYFGRGIVAYFDVTNIHISDAIMFGSSLFGLSFAGNLVKEMGPLIRSISARWGSPPEEK